MGMDRVEVLVHIGAPCAAKDDKRYRGQAEAIARFESATMKQVWPGSQELSKPSEDPNVDQLNLSFETFLAGWGETLKETPARPHNPLPFTRAAGQPTSSTPSNVSPASFPAAKRTSFRARLLRSPSSPPYTNPLLDRQLHEPVVQAKGTPEQLRSRTALEADSSIGRDNISDRVTRKRTRSVSSSFQSRPSIVPETPLLRHRMAEPSANGPSIQHPLTAAEPIAQHRSPKRCCLDETTILENGLEIHLAPLDERRRSEPYVVQDHSLELVASSAPSIFGHADNFSSPSRHLPALTRSIITTTETPCMPPLTYGNPSAPINLISQDLYTTPLDLPPIPSPIPSSSPAPPNSSRPTTTNYTTISSLPTTITPPPPPTGHGPFRTHVTPTLAAMFRNPVFEKTFRPVRVTRDIHNLERGYWRIPITVASAAAVAGARKKDSATPSALPPRKEPMSSPEAAKWLAQRGQEDAELERRGTLMLSSSPTQAYKEGNLVKERKKMDFWTEAEVIEFWEALEGNIKAGLSGWGVRVYREGREQTVDEAEVLATASGSERTPPRHRQVVIRVSGWGEVVGHLWFLLWVLSRKLTGWCVMEWRDGRDEPVVTMSGHRKKRGVLGRWVFKGPEGEDGVWGIGPLEEA